MRRDFKEADIAWISAIHASQRDLGVPSLKNVVANSVFKEGNVPVAYGVIKNFAEAVLIIDQKANNITKAKVIKESIKYGLEQCKEKDVEILYIIVDEKKYPGYTAILQNHFGAKPVPGKLLMIEIEDK